MAAPLWAAGLHLCCGSEGSSRLEERQCPRVPAGVHVQRPRHLQGGHDLDTLVWPLLGSVSASLNPGGSSLERVHVSLMSLVTKAVTCSEPAGPKNQPHGTSGSEESAARNQWVWLNQSFNEAQVKTRNSGNTAEVPGGHGFKRQKAGKTFTQV